MYNQNFNLGFKDQDNLSRIFSYSIGKIHITGTGKQLVYMPYIISLTCLAEYTSVAVRLIERHSIHVSLNCSNFTSL